MQDLKLLLKELHEKTTSAYIAAARQGQGRGVDPDIQADTTTLIFETNLKNLNKLIRSNLLCIDAATT